MYNTNSEQYHFCLVKVINRKNSTTAHWQKNSSLTSTRTDYLDKGSSFKVQELIVSFSSFRVLEKEWNVEIFTGVCEGVLNPAFVRES